MPMSMVMIQLQRQFADALKMPKSKIEPFDGNAVDYFQFICESESSLGKYCLVSTLDECKGHIRSYSDELKLVKIL